MDNPDGQNQSGGLQKPTQTFRVRGGTGTEDASSLSPDVLAEVKRVSGELGRYHDQRLKRLRDLDFFILDNSMRESTVGQIRSHTLENKKAIFEQIKKCGITDVIVAAFSHMTRVDDDFCQYLRDSGHDFSGFYSFSEACEGLKDGRYDTERIPVACLKNKKYGIRNTILEVDLATPECDWDKSWTVKDHCELLAKRFKWLRTEIHPEGKLFINFRDFSKSMTNTPGRVLQIVHFLSSMPAEERIFGLVYEDLGECLPDELGVWTESVRNVMDACGWTDGHLLFHAHDNWDLKSASTMTCLERGANGVWASLCEEGAASGHAPSTVTAMNLVRLGNTKILEKYNCVEMREAARQVTKITTGAEPHPRQVLYGDRALDLVYGFPLHVVREFDLAKFFGVEPIRRMSTMASAEMIREKLVMDFGEDPRFTMEIAAAMKEKMVEDLRDSRKEEYMSKCGMALLFDRAGGQVTEKMRDAIDEVEPERHRHKQLIAEVRELWDKWDLNDEVQDDERLQFDSFYHGFLSPYFGCYRCTTTKQALQALDMDRDGYVDWSEFTVYLKWALAQHPNVATADDLLDITFQKGLVPAMRDVHVNSFTDSAM